MSEVPKEKWQRECSFPRELIKRSQSEHDVAVMPLPQLLHSIANINHLELSTLAKVETINLFIGDR